MKYAPEASIYFCLLNDNSFMPFAGCTAQNDKPLKELICIWESKRSTLKFFWPIMLGNRSIFWKLIYTSGKNTLDIFCVISAPFFCIEGWRARTEESAEVIFHSLLVIEYFSLQEVIQIPKQISLVLVQ